ncbi:MAG: undecaprenyl-phosphate glucose phosphotransferase [Clostridia bacterium]|nr:undecaprenyl-phosphate glucose phosphotransferase [Clostridia bacterium]
MGQIEKYLAHFLSAIADFIINFASIMVALVLVITYNSIGGTAVAISVAVALASVLIYFAFDLYSTKVFAKLHTQIIKILIAQLLNLTIGIVFFAIFSIMKYYLVALISVGVSSLAIIVKKIITTKFIHYLRITKKRVKKVIIVGGSGAGKEYENQINLNKHYGYVVVGYVSVNREIENKLGTYKELDSIIKEYKPHEIVLALSSSEEHNLQEILEVCDTNGTRAMIIPTTYRYFKAKCQVDMIGNVPVINTRTIPLDNPANAFAKRLMDIVISSLMILVLSPIMLFAMIGVKLSSKGPAIFKQKRVGKNNEEFTMYKFRSMRVNEMSDTAWTTNEDKRKTKFGTFLRKTGIDELPQLFNVLFGSMSIVGPRPELPKFVEEYSKTIPLYKVKHQVKPGITGLAQIYGYRGDTSIERRIELDIKYIEEWSVYNDIKIILTTPFKMFNRNEKYVK